MKTMLEMGNKGRAIPASEFGDCILFREKYYKGFIALFYIKDFILGYGFGVNISKG